MPDFTNHKIQLETGDTIYLFTDGFMDQFGGPSGKKFMKKNFISMLIKHQNLDMKSQKKTFEEILDKWIHDPSEKNTHSEQIDDILILGIRV
jgi:serine phosphatase RsbU (regulator of sigma subunit)